MISRRHIRLKVMQSLYAFHSKKENSISKSEKDMLNHIQDISNLKLSILSLFFYFYISMQIIFLKKIKINFFQRMMILTPIRNL